MRRFFSRFVLRKVINIRLAQLGRQAEEFYISYDSGLMFERRLYVPVDNVVKTKLLTEAHSSPFSMHPGSTKMYQDLKRVNWWRNMRREVAHFVSRCLVCQQVKAPRLKPTGLLQPLSVPGWKWESVSMDFITGLPRTLKGYTVIWAVVDRLTKSAHFIQRKSTYTAKMPDSPRSSGKNFNLLWTRGWTSAQPFILRLLVKQRVIRLPLAWHRLRLCMVGVADLLYVRVAPMKGVLRFEKKGKLSPRFVGPFEILERIGPVAYRLALPPSFFALHDVFHVSMLRKEVKMLRNRGITLVKVLWRNHEAEEVTWKREDDMRAQYPELFED
ncbi:retrotransposon protein, putative, Ty3-gypsy subclass [Cucumis melo var. makuwa]|uniref:Retrotransposon protein, putative, Ty3-gypsy subclass n=1 Tax=Cucumis melo var. makuwa TaxID=1194695 RepID=A0A5A7TWZ8_CUCMM|nr:retrotransposon protein, putative, Ty3-gypsy subclass [Cucumis melo var. makuwa]